MSDNTIRVTTEVDASAARSGMAEFAGSVQANLAVAKEQFRQASTEIQQSVGRIASAEKQAAEAAAAGHASLASSLQGAANVERAALDSVIQKHVELGGAVKQLESQITSATAHIVPEMAASSAAIRVFEGSMPIRAVERFAATTLGLGPIMRAAFPVVGAIALGEVLFHVAGEVKKLYDNFIELKEVQEAVAEVEERLAHATISSWEKTQHLAAEHLKNMGHFVEAAKLEASTLRSTPIELGEFLKTDEIDKKLKELPKEAREALKQTFTSITPDDIAPLTDRLQKAVADANSKMAAGRSSEAIAGLISAVPALQQAGVAGALFSERGVNQQKALADIYSGLIQHLGQRESEYAGETTLAKDKINKAREEEAHKAEEAARKVEAAMRQQEQALAKSDAAQFTAILLNAEETGVARFALLTQEKNFLKARIDAEGEYPDLVEAHRAKLAEVLRESAANTKEVMDRDAHTADEALKKQIDFTKRMEDLGVEAARIQEKLAADSAKQQRDVAAEIQKGAEEHAKAVADAQKIAAEGGAQLGLGNPFGAPSAASAGQRIRTLGSAGSDASGADAALAATHKKQFDDDMAAQQQLEKLYADEPVKLQEIKNKEIQIQDQYNQRVLQDSLKSIKDQEAQWDGFFNTFNQGLTRSLNAWIINGQSFSKSMRNVFADLVAQEADYIAMTLAKDAEKWIMKKLFATSYAAVQAALQATQVAQAAATDATVATEKAAINVAMVQSNSAVAASAAFADNILGHPRGCGDRGRGVRR